MTRLTYIRYPGGKSRALKKISKYIPNDFDEYREPFLGGGSVFLMLKRKHPERRFWVNDINPSVYAFWKIAQDDNERMVDRLSELKERTTKNNGNMDVDLVKNTFLVCRKIIKSTVNLLDRAVCFYYLNKTSFSGLTENGTCSPLAWQQNFSLEGIEALRELEPLLQGVRITNLDYSELLGGDDCIFTYCDPPYDLSKQNAALYGRNGNLHKNFDHEKFFQEIRGCQNQFLITYNDNEHIRSLASGLNIATEQMRYTMRQTGKRRDKSKTGNELFIRNAEVIMRDNSQDFASKFVEKKIQFFGLSGQNDPKLVQNQTKTGHDAEWIAFHWLKSIGRNPTEPDPNVYDTAGKKVWEDLKDRDRPFIYHIKSCTTGTELSMHGLGFTFQLGKNGRYPDPLIEGKCTNNDYIICVSEYQNRVVAALPAKKLKEYLCYNCKKDKQSLVGHKAWIHIEKLPSKFIISEQN